MSLVNDSNSSSDSNEQTNLNNFDETNSNAKPQESLITCDQEGAIGGNGEEFLYSGGVSPVERSECISYDYYPPASALPIPSSNWYNTN